MLMWIIILSLLLIGLALIVVELLFIPGTTVVGLLGLIFTVTGIVISYSHFGNDVGFYILLGTLATTILAFVYSFRSGAWSRFSLKSSSEGKVNEGMIQNLHIGDEGLTNSTLRPFGKATFNDKTIEVKTSGDYVEQGQKVKIIHIELNQITVQPIN
jgi:membrane-bound ClpP family serine protease